MAAGAAALSVLGLAFGRGAEVDIGIEFQEGNLDADLGQPQHSVIGLRRAMSMAAF